MRNMPKLISYVLKPLVWNTKKIHTRQIVFCPSLMHLDRESLKMLQRIARAQTIWPELREDGHLDLTAFECDDIIA